MHGAAAFGEPGLLGVACEASTQKYSRNCKFFSTAEEKNTGCVRRGNIPGGVQGRGESGNVCEDVTFMAKPDD